MAASPVSGVLMLHQKDEHDIWICKACGWKYPNAKPSAKIRKHHKRQCPGTGGPESHHSEDITDDEHSDGEHHHGHYEGHGRDHDATLSASGGRVDKDKSLQGNGPETGNGSVAGQDLAEQDGSRPEGANAVSARAEDSASLMMAHQKDEHDIWNCKACGWKYPNAKPSPKVKRHHRKQCPGRKVSDMGITGESSDEHEHEQEHEHLEDEHLHGESPARPASSLVEETSTDKEGVGVENREIESHTEEPAPAKDSPGSERAKRSVRFEDGVAPGESETADGFVGESSPNAAESGRPDIQSGADGTKEEKAGGEEKGIQESRETSVMSGADSQNDEGPCSSTTVQGEAEDAFELHESTSECNHIAAPVESKHKRAVNEWACGRKGALGMKLIQEKKRARWVSGGRWNTIRSF